MIWILPLFPAEPKLGPVLNPVTQFIPPGFPLAFLIPALVMDWLAARFKNSPAWLPFALGAVGFVTFFVAEWPLAQFILQSPLARNPIVGSIYLDYTEGPRSLHALRQFFPSEPTGLFVQRMLIGLAASMLSARLGVACADWMQRVRR